MIHDLSRNKSPIKLLINKPRINKTPNSGLHTKSHGQATTETLLTLLVFVPLFILIPYLGKYLDVKHYVVNASRYVTWERTVFGDEENSWEAGENSKSDTDIALEANHRILGDPRSAIIATENIRANNFTDNPLWTDHVGASLISPQSANAAAGTRRVSQVGVDEEAAPVSHGTLPELVAFGGVPFDNNPISSVVSKIIDLLPSPVDLPTDIGLGLNENGFVVGEYGVPLKPLPDFESKGASVDIELPDVEQAPLTINQTAAILTDAWIPGSEDNFIDRLDGIVLDEPLQIIVNPGTFLFGTLDPNPNALFREGDSGFDPKLESSTSVLPPGFITIPPEAFGGANVGSPNILD